MPLILRGLCNFAGALFLFGIGLYPLIWSLFFLLEGIQGHSYGDYVAFQVLTAGLACLGATAMLFASGAFLCARGWYLLRRYWPDVAKIEFDPVTTKALASRNWIGFAAVALATIPPYFMIWGPPNWSTLGPTVAYYGMLFVVLWIPSVIIHEFLHGIGWWIAACVPSNLIRFGVLARYGGAYAYTHNDMTVRAGQFALILPVLPLGILPAYTGLILGQPVLLAYGLLMVFASGGDLLITWHTLKFPGSASLNSCAEDDAFLGSIAQVKTPGEATGSQAPEANWLSPFQD